MNRLMFLQTLFYSHLQSRFFMFEAIHPEFGIRAVLIDPSIPILITSARYKLLREWAHAYFHNRWWSILTVGNIYIYTTQLKIHHSEYTEESNPVPIPVMVYLNPNVNWTFIPFYPQFHVRPGGSAVGGLLPGGYEDKMTLMSSQGASSSQPRVSRDPSKQGVCIILLLCLIYLPIYLSTVSIYLLYLSIYCIYLSTVSIYLLYLSIYCIYLSTVSIDLSIDLSFDLSIYLSLSIYLYRSIDLSIYPKAPLLKKNNRTIDFLAKSIFDWKQIFFNRFCFHWKFKDWISDWFLKSIFPWTTDKFLLISRLIFLLISRLNFRYIWWLDSHMLGLTLVAGYKPHVRVALATCEGCFK